jgi:thiol:disulfide interchange protein DsbA
MELQFSHFSVIGGSMKSLILIYKEGYVRKKFEVALLAILLSVHSGVGGLKTARGAENHLPSFGSGSIEVRLYTDYFCSPCRDMEPSLEPLLIDLVKDGTIHLTFVDTPTGRYTSLFAKYFLYGLSERKDLDYAILARKTLFEAAENRVLEKERLENLLGRKGIKFKVADVRPVFEFWNRYLKEDQIRSTPSCVIVHENQKEVYKGSLEVLKALENLKEKFGKRHMNSGKAGEAKKAEMGEDSAKPRLVKKGE